MCGIVGYVGRRRHACRSCSNGLGQVEYRGYDSAGIAVVTPSGGSRRAPPRRQAARRSSDGAARSGFAGTVGIGHTRWATHGAPTDGNAHPHVDASGRIAIVHNGIIENAAELRGELEAAGVEFASDTDTEVHRAPGRRARSGRDVAARGRRPRGAGRIEGTYGIAVHRRRPAGPHRRRARGSPIVIGIGDSEMLVASDVAALVRHTPPGRARSRTASSPCSTADGYRTFALDAHADAEAAVRPSTGRPSRSTLDGHEHFMHKEILEQPRRSSAPCAAASTSATRTAKLGGIDLDARDALGDPPRQAARLRHRLLRGHRRRAADRGPRAHPRRRRAGRPSSATATR